MDYSSRAEQRRAVDALLELEYEPNDPLKEKIRAAVEEAYANAEDAEWEEVARRFASAFPQVPKPTRTTVLQDRGFDGLVRTGTFARYLEWTSEHESPTQFHFGAAVTVVAAGLGRRPLIGWEARPLYPNLYTLLVGPTGARKGAAIDRAVRLISSAMPINLLPNEGTHQGFAARLKRRMGETSGDSADGLIVAPEFSVLMSRDRNKEDLVKWITDWYDSPDHWERALRGEEFYELRNVCVSVLGGSNMPWLKDMPTTAIESGFMPRHIVFDAPGKRFWKARPTFNRKLGDELGATLARVAATVPETIGLDSTGGAWLDDWYERELRSAYEATNDERLHAWYDRKQAAVMKLATVWQLADAGPLDFLAKEWLECARRVVDWGDKAVNTVYGALGVSSEGQAAADVQTALRAAGGHMPKRTVIRVLKGKYTSARVTGAFNTLMASGEAHQIRMAGEGIVWALL